MFKVIKKADILLFLVILILGLGLSWYASFGSTKGSQVLVTVDGKEYGTYDLNQDQTIQIKTKKHINKFTIKGGTVQMTESNCKNQVCVHEGAISQTNQSIVCLPHKVVIEVKGGAKYDAISQ